MISHTMTQAEADRQHEKDVLAWHVWEGMIQLLKDYPDLPRGDAVRQASEGVPDEVWADGKNKQFLRFEAHKAFTAFRPE